MPGCPAGHIRAEGVLIGEGVLVVRQIVGLQLGPRLAAPVEVAGVEQGRPGAGRPGDRPDGRCDPTNTTSEFEVWAADCRRRVEPAALGSNV